MDNYEDLCDLIVSERLKSSLIAHLAPYINERKMKTSSAAAVLEDEYVLTHASGSVFGQIHREGQQRENLRFRTGKSLGVIRDPAHLAVRHILGTNGRFDPARIITCVKTKGTGKENVQPVRLAKNLQIPVYM